MTKSVFKINLEPKLLEKVLEKKHPRVFNFFTCYFYLAFYKLLLNNNQLPENILLIGV